MSQSVKNKGWVVTFSGTGINLALGILYTWSIFKGAIKKSIETGGEGAFNWELASLNDPYAVCCLFFAFATVLAGKCQDKYGPRITALIGGVLVGLGFMWISQTTDYVSWVLGFGVLAGVGIGFGYSAATPPGLKWFPAAKTGLIAGLVVSGFGLASVYIAPLSKYLLGIWGLQNAMLFFGIAFLIVVCGLSMLLVNPPAGYVPGEAGTTTVSEEKEGIRLTPTIAGWLPESISAIQAKKEIEMNNREIKPSEIMKKADFYILWFIFFIGAGVGLMVIGSVAGMAKKSMGELAFLVVAILAIGNAGGRIIAGILSDRIGRSYTLIIMLLFQAVLMFVAIPIFGGESTSAVLLVLIATFIGFNYGTNLSLFPSYTKDLWGMKNFGINYGIVFTAWGVGGFVLGRLSQMLKASTGTFTSSFFIAGVLLIIGAALTLVLKASLARQGLTQKRVT
ncbi:MAG: OFA family MFS transporter [Deltaproteobacteria bacterium]|nr:OFA family MFS transporter [Deltaproteobacteria bacterium]MBW2168876.1 OFA family MFS transporter [Deltaproteobacteria bacterium]